MVVGALVALLILIVLAFAVLRVLTDVPLLAAGEPAPPGSIGEAYVAQPVLAYAHIVPGVLYLLLAPFQLSARFRDRHRLAHRRMGRVALALGVVSGVFGLAFGVPFAFGGPWESLAAAVFGAWFLVALLLAYRAIRRGDVRTHRRFMIRAFAVGVGVGTIRIWIGVFEATGVLTGEAAFAPAFWLGFGLHVLVGELWLLAWPDPPVRATRAR
ncbi:hypothetical protein ARHIZOSPH14_11110 [Agromyces rhizosphaerae]|uniref:DUF2306 domain-containing protein n=1 Tax=Agromyces rhizosphaerae TaxID=88374 RepID=A0A9W6CU50_9MICO|nr:hypothetical protein ARHIZOSPH14_11110 [Agromyces rhizosphaerae]